jgi:methylmalonyl-CoA mutase N-terminal domain/subunit
MTAMAEEDVRHPALPARDQPWVMRTYSGHSTARASNELCRTTLATGQTGLSVAFDLATQTGYDPKPRRFSYGVQVNSLGLTEQQPETTFPASSSRPSA